MSENSLTQLFRPELKQMSAYKVVEAGNMIKLDAMENPYSWPEEHQLRWLNSLKTSQLNRYPDAAATELSLALRRNNGIPESADILLGNGSDEIIQILLMALPMQACVMAPEPSFVMYRQIAQSLGLQYVGSRLLPDSFELDLSSMLADIHQYQPALIFLAYPNNPTGNLFDAQLVKQILNASSGLVVIDEAYAPFADASFIDQLENYENLLVMRTVSKLGLAGLRLGFLAGNPVLLAELNKLRLPYNINCLTQTTALYALNHTEFLLEQTQSIREQRSLVFSALQALPNLQVYPSAANFVLFKPININADQVFASLKRQGILIKNLSHQAGLLENCLRVTIGTPEENQAFLVALENALNAR